MMVVMMVVYTTADPATFLIETEDNPADAGMYIGFLGNTVKPAPENPLHNKPN